MTEEPTLCPRSKSRKCCVREEHVHAFGIVYYGSYQEAMVAWNACKSCNNRELREAAFDRVLSHVREANMEAKDAD